MRGLTENQRETLAFIKAFTTVHDYPPTIQETADHFAITGRAAHDRIEALITKGELLRDKHSRTLHLPPGNGYGENNIVEVPVLGMIAAGKPIHAEENYDGTVPLRASLLKKGKSYFAVVVRGDSMTGAGILDGDTAVIMKASAARNGEIVAARLNDDAMTLKRFFREPNRIRLQAENPAYEPIYSTEVEILGTLSHIIRAY
jgi:repressor LexA